MAKYDVENFVQDVRTLYLAELNNEINAINTEKGDSLLNTIETEAWYFMNVPTYKNNKEFIVWGIQDINTSEVSEINFVKNITIGIEAVIPETEEKDYTNLINKLLRYGRALEQVTTNNFDYYQSFCRPKVNSLQPTTFFYDRRKFLSVGITLEAALTLT